MVMKSAPYPGGLGSRLRTTWWAAITGMSDAKYSAAVSIASGRPREPRRRLRGEPKTSTSAPSSAASSAHAVSRWVRSGHVVRSNRVSSGWPNRSDCSPDTRSSLLAIVARRARISDRVGHVPPVSAVGAISMPCTPRAVSQSHRAGSTAPPHAKLDTDRPFTARVPSRWSSAG